MAFIREFTIEPENINEIQLLDEIDFAIMRLLYKRTESDITDGTYQYPKDGTTNILLLDFIDDLTTQEDTDLSNTVSNHVPDPNYTKEFQQEENFQFAIMQMGTATPPANAPDGLKGHGLLDTVFTSQKSSATIRDAAGFGWQQTADNIDFGIIKSDQLQKLHEPRWIPGQITRLMFTSLTDVKYAVGFTNELTGVDERSAQFYFDSSMGGAIKAIVTNELGSTEVVSETGAIVNSKTYLLMIEFRGPDGEVRFEVFDNDFNAVFQATIKNNLPALTDALYFKSELQSEVTGDVSVNIYSVNVANLIM